MFRLLATTAMLALMGGAAQADFVLHVLHTNDFHSRIEPINKYELLTMIKRALDLKVNVVPDDAVKCDRSLDCRRFIL